MTATNKQQTFTPDLPRSSRVVNEDGTLTTEWKLFFENLVLGLQTNLKPAGIVLPQQTASNIALLTTVTSLANILYNSTNNTFMGNVQTGPNTYTWKTFTLT